MGSLRHASRMITDLCSYVARTGSWWLPVSVVALAAGALLAATAKAAVPTVVYVLF